MIISEKQIMRLLAIANDVMVIGSDKTLPDGYCASVQKLIKEIANQQSEELKVIK